MTSAPIGRWAEDRDGVMKPVIARIHTIPLEGGDLIHCAQMTCWCSPLPSPDEPAVINHNAVAAEPDGWVLIGEHDPSAPAEAET